MSVKSFLNETLKDGQRTVVLGVGSVLRSDDGAGMYFIERLSGLIQRENLLLIAGSTAPENFTGVIKKFAPHKLFIVDAAFMGLSPGEIHVLDIVEIEGISFSTHMLPLSVMLSYLNTEIGCEIICIGIQPENTELGCEMCEKVAIASESLASMFYEAIEEADHLI